MVTFTVEEVSDIKKTNFSNMKEFLDYGVDNGLFWELWVLDFDGLSFETQKKINNRRKKSNLINI